MRSDWNDRAKENAQYYVQNETKDWDQREFFRSGGSMSHTHTTAPPDAASREPSGENISLARRERLGLEGGEAVRGTRSTSVSVWGLITRRSLLVLSMTTTRLPSAEGITPFHLPSGAGHDGMAMIAIADIGMIFLRCEKGISHNPAEAITVEDAETGARVLLRFIEHFRASA